MLALHVQFGDCGSQTPVHAGSRPNPGPGFLGNISRASKPCLPSPPPFLLSSSTHHPPLLTPSQARIPRAWCLATLQGAAAALSDSRSRKSSRRKQVSLTVSRQPSSYAPHRFLAAHRDVPSPSLLFPPFLFLCVIPVFHLTLELEAQRASAFRALRLHLLHSCFRSYHIFPLHPL